MRAAFLALCCAASVAALAGSRAAAAVTPIPVITPVAVPATSRPSATPAAATTPLASASSIAAPSASSAPSASAAPSVSATAVPGTSATGPLLPLSVAEAIAQHPITGDQPTAFLWSPHGLRYLYRVAGDAEGSAPVEHVVDLASGRDRRLLATRATARGTRSRAIDQIAWAPDDVRVAVAGDDGLRLVDVRTSRTTRIAGPCDDPAFSPDGRRIACVRGGNLQVITLAGRGAGVRSQAVTSDGSADVLDGEPDWLYSEELNVTHGFAWAPDGRSIAYLQFDDRPVTSYPIQDYAPVLNAVEQQRYPLAGAANPRVSLRVVDVTRGGRPASRVLYDGGPHDEYVTSLSWSPDSKGVYDTILPRDQRFAQVIRFEADGSSYGTEMRESDPHFVDVQPAPTPLRNGRIVLALSTRGGVQGLDALDRHDGRIRRLTGTMPIVALLGVSEARRTAYVEALYPTRRDRALVAVAFDGSRTTVLTQDPAYHEFAMPAAGGPAYVDTVSDLNVPPVVRRRTFGSNAALVLFRTPSLAGRTVATASALTIPSPDGPLDATLSVPADFDSKKKYPVLVTVYGGPLPVGDHLSNRWPGLNPTLLAERGVLTLDIEAPGERDDRTSYEHAYSGSMGTTAIDGPLAATAWLAQQPYADTSRVGLYGWSYGGYLTAFAMTHGRQFRSGIAGAPPTDWRLYDSAYTERYLGLPSRNGAAYERSSVIAAASSLAGSLLVIHGSADDNVHLANTLAFVNACIQAGKPVETFVLPFARHGPTGIPSRRYLETLMLDWWTRTLVR